MFTIVFTKQGAVIEGRRVTFVAAVSAMLSHDAFDAPKLVKHQNFTEVGFAI